MTLTKNEWGVLFMLSGFVGSAISLINNYQPEATVSAAFLIAGAILMGGTK